MTSSFFLEHGREITETEKIALVLPRIGKARVLHFLEFNKAPEMKSKYGFTDAQTFFYALRRADPVSSHVNGRQPLVPVSDNDMKLVVDALYKAGQGTELPNLIETAMD